MKKNLLYVALGLMGLMGTLSIGVVSAEATITTIDAPGAVGYSGLKFDDGNGHMIMLLDRNLGAITTGAGVSASTGSYGYHYQRGNNHGFESCYSNGCSDFLGGEVLGQENVDISQYNNFPSTYNSGVFIKSLAYNDFDFYHMHKNLRGGSGDTRKSNSPWSGQINLKNLRDRRGPCPEGYHIPSAGELYNLFAYWMIAKGYTDNYATYYEGYDSNVYEEFSQDFYIPFAGVRGGLQFGSVSNKIEGQGRYAFIWSSTPMHDDFGSDGFEVFGDEEGNLNGAGDLHAGVGVGGSIRCFYNSYLLSGYVIVYFYDGYNEVLTDTITQNSIRNGDKPSLNKDGYKFEYRHLTGTDKEFDFSNNITSDVKLYAKRNPIEYKIESELDGGTNNPNNVTGYTIETPTITLENPTKDGYTFDGWFLDTGFTTQITEITQGTTGNIILYAKWTENKKPSGGSSSGGGGRSKTSNDSQISPDPSLSRGEEDSSLIKEGDGEAVEDLDSNTPIDSSDKSSEGQKILSPSDSSFTKEQKEAYEFAKEKGITTMPTINDANMNGKLTRIAMAKMLSYYAINVLGMKPDETRINKFNDITEKLDTQYDSGVTLAYQLGIMGINMPDNKFRPNDEVTRAEFSTALSRMLYSTPDGKPYYSTHLEKLKAEKIITNDDYKMKELRGYVMIMLMRSAK